MTDRDNAKGQRIREVAKVDFLVDENGMRVNLPEGDTGLRAAGDPERAVGSTGPASRWWLGLIAVGIVALVLLGMQFLNGGARTVVPATPAVQTNP
jgi:hypothetical protein